jgi:endonuclease YncB( thermonuclease family)
MTGTPAGWYADPQGPHGQLRYWDGRGWTSHTARPQQAPPPPAGYVPAAPAYGVVQSVSQRNWVMRHKLLATVLAVVLSCSGLGILGSLVDDPQEPAAETANDPSAQPSDTAESSSAPSGTPSEPPTPSESPTPKPPKTYLVASVTDGDTLDLANGETVRLVGMDAPESGECGYERAASHLAELLTGERVLLTVARGEERNRYGRLLRYVDVGGVDVGLNQIEKGFAIARYDSRDGYGRHEREAAYLRADKASKTVSCAKPQPLVQQPDQNCAAGYTPCIPPYPPDLDCADVGGPIYVTGSDPHGLDADGDGVACES